MDTSNIKYKITVSEPWDFSSSMGENVIIGRIVRKVTNRSLIFKSDTELLFGEYKGDLFLLRARYYDALIKEDGFYHGTVNGGMVISEIGLFEGADEVSIEACCKFVLIGHLEPFVKLVI